MTKKQRYQYDAAHSEEAYRQRFLTGFTGLLFRARAGEAAPLCNYLLSNKPLADEDREGLAWLVHNALQAAPAAPIGRRPGRASTPRLDALWEVYDLVCARREAERAAAGRLRLPKGRLDQLIKETMRDVDKRRPGQLDIRLPADAAHIRKMLDR